MGQYSYINLRAENIQNLPSFWEALEEAVEAYSSRIMSGNKTADNTHLRTSIGDTLFINNSVSDNYMLNNAGGEVQLIITDKARLFI